MMILFFPILLLAAFVSVVLQHFIPPLPWVAGARVMLLPVVFFYSALALPLPGMLAMAFVTGFMWDALNTQVIDNSVELSLGWSIAVCAALGAIANGFRPVFRRGRWEIHCLASGILTGVFVLAEYLMITFRRGVFVFPEAIWYRIGGTGLVALVLAPIVYVVLKGLAVMVRYDPSSAAGEVTNYGTPSPWSTD
jgi:hypothetical protein